MHYMDIARLWYLCLIYDTVKKVEKTQYQSIIFVRIPLTKVLLYQRDSPVKSEN